MSTAPKIRVTAGAYLEATARGALHNAMQQLGTAADAMRHARRPDLSEAIAEALRQVGALYDAACRAAADGPGLY